MKSIKYLWLFLFTLIVACSAINNKDIKIVKSIPVFGLPNRIINAEELAYCISGKSGSVKWTTNEIKGTYKLNFLEGQQLFSRNISSSKKRIVQAEIKSKENKFEKIILQYLIIDNQLGLNSILVDDKDFSISAFLSYLMNKGINLNDCPTKERKREEKMIESSNEKQQVCYCVFFDIDPFAYKSWRRMAVTMVINDEIIDRGILLDREK